MAAANALTPGDAARKLIGFRIAQPAEVSALAEPHIGLKALPPSPHAHRCRAAASSRRRCRRSFNPVDLNVDRLRSATAIVALSISRTTTSPARCWAPRSGDSRGTQAPPDRPTRPLNAVMDPVTASAAVNGIVTVERRGVLQVHPRAVVDRFPGVGARFAILDIATLQPALDLRQPSAGTATIVARERHGRLTETLLAQRLTGRGLIPSTSTVAPPRRMPWPRIRSPC